MKIDANGAVGEAGASGDFGAGHAFDEAKNEGLAVGVGERADGVEHRMGFGPGVRGVTSGRGDLFGLRGGGCFVEFFVGFDAAVKIGGAIASDGGEPSGETRDFAESAEAGQGLKEDVLHEVGDIGEGNAGKQKAVDHSGVTGVQEAEGGAISALSGANEGVVGAAGFVKRIHGWGTGAG